MRSSNDVCDGQQLSKSATNTFPSPDYWEIWAELFDNEFIKHNNNIIKIVGEVGSYFYYIDRESEFQFLQKIMLQLASTVFLDNFHQASTVVDKFADFKIGTVSYHNNVSNNDKMNHSVANKSHHSRDINSSNNNKQWRSKLNINHWTDEQLYPFLRLAVRGFLRNDLYSAMTEFLSRAEGSFGLQVGNLEGLVGV